MTAVEATGACKHGVVDDRCAYCEEEAEEGIVDGVAGNVPSANDDDVVDDLPSVDDDVDVNAEPAPDPEHPGGVPLIVANGAARCPHLAVFIDAGTRSVDCRSCGTKGLDPFDTLLRLADEQERRWTKPLARLRWQAQDLREKAVDLTKDLERIRRERANEMARDRRTSRKPPDPADVAAAADVVASLNSGPED